MAKTKFSSPTLNLSLSEEEQEAAIRSNSGGCLVADAIRGQYPQFSRVVVDMATIRFSDLKAGNRYTYLTPPTIQHVLLSFDQGWPQAPVDVVLKRAVHISPTFQNRSRDRSREYANRNKLRALRAKVSRGEELTSGEKNTMTKLTKEKKASTRPPKRAKVEVDISPGQGSGRGNPVVYGGLAPVMGPDHPNLLRGRDRHFGARLADPGMAFRQAVEAAVAREMAARAEAEAS